MKFQVPDDSKAFSNLQIDRLLKRNEINEQLQLVQALLGAEKIFFPISHSSNCALFNLFSFFF